MRFKNRLSDKPLRFTLDTTLFSVEPGGYVEIPDKFIYAIASMGILLDEAPPATAPESAVVPEPPKKSPKKSE